MAPDAMQALQSLAMLLLVVAMVCGGCWLHAQLGWSSLARVYRTSRERPAQMYNFCSGTMNWFCNYRIVLRVGFVQEGLYLAVWPLLRIGHPPLLIPYADIHPTGRSFLFLRAMTI